MGFGTPCSVSFRIRCVKPFQRQIHRGVIGQKGVHKTGLTAEGSE